MHDVKNTCDYKDMTLSGTHWYIKYLREKIYNDYNNVVLFWNFYQLSRTDVNSKIILHVKRFQSIKFRKTLEQRRLAILRFSQDNPQNNLSNFLTFKHFFITFQYFGDILGIFFKRTFVECSSNTLEKLFHDYWYLPKDQLLLLPNHTILTQKQLLNRELFKNCFSFKMFPKSSLDVPSIATLREHSTNIPGILPAGWNSLQANQT